MRQRELKSEFDEREKLADGKLAHIFRGTTMSPAVNCNKQRVNFSQ
jgi:hypothetical protein